jgi:hypothetical protein
LPMASLTPLLSKLLLLLLLLMMDKQIDRQ